MESAVREDYLRGLYVLHEEKDSLRSVDLAEYLKVSKPSVSEMLRELDRDGLVEYKKYSKITLTKKGMAAARKLTAKHRIIELFLAKTLKLDPRKVHDEAHRLEHAFSDESISSMRRLLGNPKLDPHGKPIP